MKLYECDGDIVIRCPIPFKDSEKVREMHRHIIEQGEIVKIYDSEGNVLAAFYNKPGEWRKVWGKEGH
jgi:hypothetical protein